MEMHKLVMGSIKNSRKNVIAMYMYVHVYCMYIGIYIYI